MDYNVAFYQKVNGEIPVKDFLLSLNPKIRAKAFRDIELLKAYGSELREPYTKPLKGKINKGIFELRIKYSSEISRIFYFSHNENGFILLHGFMKKNSKTPVREIERARKYKEDFERRYEYE